MSGKQPAKTFKPAPGQRQSTTSSAKAPLKPSTQRNTSTVAKPSPNKAGPSTSVAKKNEEVVRPGPGGSKIVTPKIPGLKPGAFPIEKRVLPNGEVEYAPKGQHLLSKQKQTFVNYWKCWVLRLHEKNHKTSWEKRINFCCESHAWGQIRWTCPGTFWGLIKQSFM